LIASFIFPSAFKVSIDLRGVFFMVSSFLRRRVAQAQVCFRLLAEALGGLRVVAVALLLGGWTARAGL
jgi:hypothetical protein